MCRKMEGGSVLERANCRAKGGAPGFKVAIQGAAGGIGQPLAMLMKMSPLVSVLHLYDVINDAGVSAHISHMDTGVVFNEEDGKVCQGRHEGGSKQIRNLWNKA
ncbi:putative malate dehydrogenase [Helianthus anomalus]